MFVVAVQGDEAANRVRNELLCKVAKLCKKQGQYHLATKKYTQASSFAAFCRGVATPCVCALAVERAT